MYMVVKDVPYAEILEGHPLPYSLMKQIMKLQMLIPELMERVIRSGLLHLHL